MKVWNLEDLTCRDEPCRACFFRIEYETSEKSCVECCAEGFVGVVVYDFILVGWTCLPQCFVRIKSSNELEIR